MPYAAEQGYAQQSTHPSVPAHAGHGDSGPSTLQSANIPQLDGAGSLEDSDNEADAATETSGSQQSGASHSDTTAGGGATASDSRETVASDAAPTVTTEGEEAGSDNQAAENVPVTGEHSNVSAQEPHSEEEQAAADSYGPDPTPCTRSLSAFRFVTGLVQRREASPDPSQADAQVTASEPGAASSWPPDSSTSPEISIGASHFPQSQTAVEAQPALSSSPGPPSSTFQGQAQEGHYAIPHAMFETVEDPLQVDCLRV